MKKRVLFLFVLAAFFIPCFAEINVINPIEGTWSNKQMLVIDTSDGSEYFYSLNGEDPSVAGFAYDGPVMIDLTGKVTVNVSKGFSGNEKKTIIFEVNPEVPFSDDERFFVYSFYDTGVLNYSAGAEIEIPSSMKYTFEHNAASFIKGQYLRCSDLCSLQRFIPCTVTNGKSKWRFMINTNPKTSGVYSRNDLPITIIDWDEISFNNQNLIYRIDNGYWSLPKENAKIDRTKNHIVYWQSIAYEQGNPVEFFELPPKPELKKEINDDGSISFYVSGKDSYSLSFVSNDSPYKELFTELCADTFYGDYLKEKCEIAVFSDSVYQGTFDADYVVDRRVAPTPQFTVNQEGFYIHGSLDLNITSVHDADLFVAVSSPLVLFDKENVSNPDAEIFKNVRAENFISYGKEHKIVLEAVNESSTFYKIRAFSKLAGMESEIVEYNVVVDNYDYFFDAAADSELADGTPEHPYVSFSQGFETIKKYKSVNIYVSGPVTMPEGKTELNFSCKISGTNNASLVFPKGASLVVKDSTFQLSGCRILSDNSSLTRNVPSSLIKIENGVFDVSNCEIKTEGLKNCTFLDADNSSVKLRNVTATVESNTYSSFVSSNNSQLDVSDIKLGIIGDTAVAFSVRGSTFSLVNSSVRITGKMGRIAELFGVSSKFYDNEYNGDLNKSKGSQSDPVYKDKKSQVDESGNYVIGF